MAESSNLPMVNGRIVEASNRLLVVWLNRGIASSQVVLCSNGGTGKVESLNR